MMPHRKSLWVLAGALGAVAGAAHAQTPSFAPVTDAMLAEPVEDE